MSERLSSTVVDHKYRWWYGPKSPNMSSILGLKASHDLHMTSLGEPAFDFASKNLPDGHCLYQRHRNSNVNYNKTVRILFFLYITLSYTGKSRYSILICSISRSSVQRKHTFRMQSLIKLSAQRMRTPHRACDFYSSLPIVLSLDGPISALFGGVYQSNRYKSLRTLLGAV